MCEKFHSEYCRIIPAHYFCNPFPKGAGSKAKVAQLVEHDLAKVGVAGSNPVFRSKSFFDLLILLFVDFPSR
tara:strand:+ start:84006 stop:84221 length:216 start_codon:yes stop_codon:yes gene_type:complete